MVRRFAWFVCGCLVLQSQTPAGLPHLIEIDPGHSHLSGLHARSLAGVSPEVKLYSPLTPELVAHLAAISRYNHRPENAPHWSVRLFAGPDFLQAFRDEPPGNIVALSGNNDKKIAYIEAALQQGEHVFADKPWIISRSDFPRLEAALAMAAGKHLVTYDWMTLREEPTYRLQRVLVGDPEVFGEPDRGSATDPAVHLENLHALLKFSGGIPQHRPASFMDIRQQGEGLADVGTHLADLAMWTLFPAQAISYKRDVRMVSAEHSSLQITLEQFQQLTGETAWPAYLKPDLTDGRLRYFANGTCVVAIRGINVRLKVGWQFQGAPGEADSYFTSFRGTKATVELRAGPGEHFVPQIYVSPRKPDEIAGLESKLQTAIGRLQGEFPGLRLEKQESRFHTLVPAPVHAGDDLLALFEQFQGFVREPKSFPDFENANLLTKYYITTQAVAMAQTGH